MGSQLEPAIAIPADGERPTNPTEDTMTTTDTETPRKAPRIAPDGFIDRLWQTMQDIEAADYPALEVRELDEPTEYGETTVLWCPRCDQHVNVEDGYLRAIDVDVRYNSVGQIDAAAGTVPIYEAEPDPGDILVYLHQSDDDEHAVRLPEGWEGVWKA